MSFRTPLLLFNLGRTKNSSYIEPWIDCGSWAAQQQESSEWELPDSQTVPFTQWGHQLSKTDDQKDHRNHIAVKQKLWGDGGSLLFSHHTSQYLFLFSWKVFALCAWHTDFLSSTQGVAPPSLRQG